MHHVPISVHRAAVASGAEESLRLLLLDDSAFDAELLDARLQRDGLRFVLHQVETEAAFRNALAQPWDLILAEAELPQTNARRALAILAEMKVPVPLVIVTADADEAALAPLIAAGAVDYVFKNRLGRLTQALRLALERARMVARLE